MRSLCKAMARPRAQAGDAAEQRETLARDDDRPTARIASTAPAFLNLAKARIERRLAADPEDPEALRQLGEVQRKLGDVGAAVETYRRLKALNGDALAAWGVCALTGEGLPKTAPEGPHPAPFVRIADFLTDDRQDMLLETMLGEREHFVPTEVIIKGKGVVDSKTHVAASAGRPILRRIRPWFVEEMLRVARGVFDRLQVDAMREIYIELSATAHRGGGFFRAHRDNAGMYPTRRVSYAYYFHREPKRFSGGELLLYDTCVTTSDYRTTAFSRIDPVHNSIVFFPSGYYHEVLPVRCESDAHEDARFTVHGWIHRSHEWEPFVESRLQAEAAAETRDSHA